MGKNTDFFGFCCYPIPKESIPIDVTKPIDIIGLPSTGFFYQSSYNESNNHILYLGVNYSPHNSGQVVIVTYDTLSGEITSRTDAIDVLDLLLNYFTAYFVSYQYSTYMSFVFDEINGLFTTVLSRKTIRVAIVNLNIYEFTEHSFQNPLPVDMQTFLMTTSYTDYHIDIIIKKILNKKVY
ncbi:hypothetical protein PPL_12073 [Heterostelium album PN500]|uniref:Uncharacterized protein n=1 Tax=Heterostelium pallidum (strain ATCC 26659 / Pp 5 / PN500) TaxID=670386 RepID=D3BLM0_HETP5|nr:hypothetical protein PPL_12073 [Heterostelium album PN500]EFA77471.1 hypothetical protein PPL_12073 [Heterostelium album PN500]|eukprot:XP_020429599.1 hypothetical protein PPL_12073 [Heterostelium album PN500]